MKEFPIQFNAEMVKAILAGRKSQSRREVKGAPTNTESYLLGVHQGVWGIHADVEKDDGVWRGKCPFGQPGDQLRISEEVTVTVVPGTNRYRCEYAADGAVIEREGEAELLAKIAAYKKPRLRGVHLPPAYARPERLRITGIAVERLNAISETDSIAEGIESVDAKDLPEYQTRKSWWYSGKLRELGQQTYTPEWAFRNLWEHVYGSDSWAKNPWVFVLSFEVLRCRT